jgi:preprotein translocase subunit SecD
MVILEERTVGPSLGADSIKEGFRAGTAGLIAVIGFMLFYYRRSGINATLALVLNAVILIAALSYFDATLTLPGIAGVILTIGMAVDSNVLIFERIREELRTGKAVVAAVDAGFSKAFLTIIDTHVTTVVSCAFLFIFGTGPVKGFAVTLVIGLIANLFTAVFVSKTIFDFELSGKQQVTALSI